VCAITKIQPKANWPYLENKGDRMGLDMNGKKKVYGEIARWCQKAGKKGRGKLLDGYTAALGIPLISPVKLG
jgi:hypothetical protein